MRKAKCGHQPCQKSQLWEESFASLQEMYSKLLTPDVVRLNSVTSSAVSAEEWACIQHWYSQHSPLKGCTALLLWARCHQLLCKEPNDFSNTVRVRFFCSSSGLYAQRACRAHGNGFLLTSHLVSQRAMATTPCPELPAATYCSSSNEWRRW